MSDVHDTRTRQTQTRVGIPLSSWHSKSRCAPIGLRSRLPRPSLAGGLPREQGRSGSSPSPLPAFSARRRRPAALPDPILGRGGRAGAELPERYDPGSRSPLHPSRTGDSRSAGSLDRRWLRFCGSGYLCLAKLAITFEEQILVLAGLFGRNEGRFRYNRGAGCAMARVMRRTG